MHIIRLNKRSKSIRVVNRINSMKVQRIGKAGIRGSVIYTGSGYPVDTYIDNDMYIDTDNGNVYQQLVGSWGTKLFSMMNINIDGGYANSIYNNQINLDGGQA